MHSIHSFIHSFIHLFILFCLFVQEVAGLCRVRKLGVPTPVPYHVDTQHDLVYCSKVDATPLAKQLDAAQQLDEGEGSGVVWWHNWPPQALCMKLCVHSVCCYKVDATPLAQQLDAAQQLDKGERGYLCGKKLE
jgi:hypothetical protein